MGWSATQSRRMENPWPVGTYTTLLLAPHREGQASERLAVPREATWGHPGAAPAWPARPLRQGAALYLPQSAGGLGLGGTRLLSCWPTTWPSILNTFPRYGPGLWGAGKGKTFDQEPAGIHGPQMRSGTRNHKWEGAESRLSVRLEMPSSGALDCCCLLACL